MDSELSVGSLAKIAGASGASGGSAVTKRAVLALVVLFDVDTVWNGW